MWLDTLSCARQGQAAVVAGMFDQTATRNQVAIIGPDGQLLATDSRRHPSRPGETVTRGTQSPAAVTEPVRLLAAIWYDLDYNDPGRPVRAMAASAPPQPTTGPTTPPSTAKPPSGYRSSPPPP
jgi:predicted amidohydrolase